MECGLRLEGTRGNTALGQVSADDGSKVHTHKQVQPSLLPTGGKFTGAL